MIDSLLNSLKQFDTYRETERIFCLIIDEFTLLRTGYHHITKLCVLSVFTTFNLRTKPRTFSKRSTKYLLLQGITPPYFVIPHNVCQKHKGCEQFRFTLDNGGINFKSFKLYMKRNHQKLRLLFRVISV